MIDNSVMRSFEEIPEKWSDKIGVRHILREFQLSDMSSRLHEVAEKVTFWEEKADSLAFDTYKTVAATAKLTTALLFW